MRSSSTRVIEKILRKDIYFLLNKLLMKRFLLQEKKPFQLLLNHTVIIMYKANFDFHPEETPS